MKRILLVVPPFYRLLGSHFNGMLLGLGYIAAILEREGFFVRIYNADYIESENYLDQREIFENYDRLKAILQDKNHSLWREVVGQIIAFNPDLVGISMYTATYRSACILAQLIKKERNDIKIAVGGTHPTLDPEGVAREGIFDYVVQGEGEQTLLEIVKGKLIKDIRGVAFNDGGIVVKDGRPFISDLDELPFPSRDLFWPKTHKIDVASIITGRGCPYRCSYCASPRIWKGRVRYRSVGNVLDELEYIASHFRVDVLHFQDDTFAVDVGRAKKICRGIIDRGIKLSWTCDNRVDRVDEELLVLMKEAGCVRIKIGIESGNDEILKSVRKGFTKKQVCSAVSLIKKVDLPFTAYLMLGFPGETDAMARETIEFGRSLEANYYSLSILAPYYGTEIYQNLMKGNNPGKKHWEYFFHQSRDMVVNDGISQGIIEEFLSLNEAGGGKRI